MAAKNLYHDAVREALVADGWTITADPLKVTFGRHNLFVDLGASRPTFAAVRGDERIAVEVQTFAGRSDVDNLHHAIGQYLIYRLLLGRAYPDHVLYMGVHEKVADGIFDEPLGRLVRSEFGVRLAVFDPVTRRFIRWTTN